MKILIFLLAAIFLVNAEKLEMLMKNKTPKLPYKKTSAVCEECKVIVTRFAEALENPEKVNELKAILRMLCHETSYVEECKIFVNRLDYFIAHIQKYLKDPESACQHLRMCGNKKIEAFHRKSVQYYESFRPYKTLVSRRNGILCEECKFAAIELKHVVEEEKSQQKLKKFLSEEVCSRLGQYQGSCDLMLDDFLPAIFEELDKILGDGESFCTKISFCSAMKFTDSSDSMMDDFSADEKVNMFTDFRM